MSLLVVDKLNLENSQDSRKSRRLNFQMGVSPRVVDWLTQEVSNKNSNQLFDDSDSLWLKNLVLMKGFMIFSCFKDPHSIKIDF